MYLGSPKRTLQRVVQHWRRKKPAVVDGPLEEVEDARALTAQILQLPDDVIESLRESIGTIGTAGDCRALAQLEPILTRQGFQCGVKKIPPVIRLSRRESEVITTNAARMLGILAYTDKSLLLSIGAVPGVVEELVDMLKDDLAKREIDSTLDVLCTLCSLKENALRCIRSGGVLIAVDILKEETNSAVIEKGLNFLKLMLCCTEGCAAAGGHAMTVPVVGKKLLRVSEAATGTAVGILWALSRYAPENEAMRRRALEAGLVGKLVLVLQVDNTENTRRTTGKLLRFLTER